MLRFIPILIALPFFALAAGAPISVVIGTTGAGLVMLAALATSWREMLVSGSPIRRAVTIAVLVYIAVHVLATLLSPWPNWNKTLEEMWLKLLLIAVPATLATRPWLATRATQTFIAASTLAAVYAVVQHFVGREFWRDVPLHRVGEYYQANGFFGHHLAYGGSVLLAWCFAMAWALQARRRALLGASVVCLILSLGLLWSYARSAQLGAVAAVIVLVLTRPRGKKWMIGGAVVLATAVLVLQPAARERFASALAPGAEETRRNLWQSSLQGIADRPVTGFGPGNFGHMMDEHGVEGFYDTKAHSHNDYLMHGVNAGLLGLGAALALILVVSGALWRAPRDAPGAWLQSGALAAQAGIAVAGLFQVYQTDDEVEVALYFLLGCALATLPAQRSALAEEHPPTTASRHAQPG